MFTNKILCCDIDNTVADQYSYYIRMYNFEKQLLDPKAYQNEHLIKYDVIENAVDALNKLSKVFEIHWLTARNPENKKTTITWLKNNKFPLDGIYLVGQNDNKLKILKSLRPQLFIDDLRYNYENLNPLPCTRFEKSLKELNINYEIFNNNWEKIETKYT